MGLHSKNDQTWLLRHALDGTHFFCPHLHTHRKQYFLQLKKTTTSITCGWEWASKRESCLLKREELCSRRKHKLVTHCLFASLNVQTCPTLPLFLLQWSPTSRFGWRMGRGGFIKYPYTRSLFCNATQQNLGMCMRKLHLSYIWYYNLNVLPDKPALQTFPSFLPSVTLSSPRFLLSHTHLPPLLPPPSPPPLAISSLSITNRKLSKHSTVFSISKPLKNRASCNAASIKFQGDVENAQLCCDFSCWNKRLTLQPAVKAVTVITCQARHRGYLLPYDMSDTAVWV